MTEVCMHRCGQLSKPSHGHQEGVSALTGLSEQFAQSMRSLFDILDRDGKGLVPLSEIERQWSDDAVPNLPGALDSLRSITPLDGMLTFEAFVWGVKASLVRARRLKRQSPASHFGNCQGSKDNCFLRKQHWYKSCERQINQSLAADGRLPSDGEKKMKSKHRRSNSGPIVLSSSVSSASWSREYLAREKTRGYVGPAVRFSVAPAVSVNNGTAGNSLSQQDSLENVKLDLSAASPSILDGNMDLSEYHGRFEKCAGNLIFNQEMSQRMESIESPDVKTSVVKFGSLQRPAMSTPIFKNSKKIKKKERNAQQIATCNRKEIAVFGKYDAALESQHNSSSSPCSVPSEGSKSGSEKPPVVSNSCIHIEKNRGGISPETRILCTPLPPARKNRKDSGILKSQEGFNYRVFEKKKSNYNRKKDARRHTVANGVDLNMLECIRKLDIEKSLLLRGIDALGRERDHILRWLEDVEHRRTMAAASYSNGGEFQSISTFSNTQLDMLSGKIDYLEELLQGLTNMQVASADSCNQSDVANSKVAERRQVKEQNKRLMEELSTQSRKIAQLEKEKCLLVQQLFKTKAELHSSTSSNNPLSI